jgi:hypothetical protein
MLDGLFTLEWPDGFKVQLDQQQAGQLAEMINTTIARPDGEIVDVMAMVKTIQGTGTRQ